MQQTAIFRDQLFLQHDPGYGHPESTERLRVVYEALDEIYGETELFYPSFKKATEESVALNHSQRVVEMVRETAGKTYGSLDPDTSTSKDSYDASLLAVGALLKGVDMMMKKEVRNCLSLVRPPGHHAEEERSMGFCLFNNIAICAKHAIEVHGLERILIFDWDVHHGNGTQNSFYDTDKVLYISSHQYPFYPGSGSLEETGSGAGEGFTINIPLPGGMGDRDYTAIVNNIVLPAAREYKPQLILVSSGLDICFQDPLGSMEVTIDGLAYMTNRLVQLADEVCDGKLLITLEGGYSLEAMRDGCLTILTELFGEEKGGNFSNIPTFGQFENMGDETQLHPAVEQARKVAKRYWNL